MNPSSSIGGSGNSSSDISSSMISSSLASSSVIMDDEMIDALATTPLEQTHLSSSPTHPTNNSNNSNNNSNSISNGSNNVEEEDGRHDLSDAQLTLRRQILSIHADPQLTQAEKAKRMQELMCAQHQLSRQASTSCSSRPQSPTASHHAHSRQGSITSAARLMNEAAQALNNNNNNNNNTIGVTLIASNSNGGDSNGDDGEVPTNNYADDAMVEDDETQTVQLKTLNGSLIRMTPQEACQTFHDDGVLGCQHYARNCKVQAACCHRWFCCRLCHDEQSNHEMNRHATTTMLCMHCQTVQPAAQNCASCMHTMARYYCAQCKLWDDSQTKSIYHCDRCGICRIGRGLGDDYFHCEKCGVCMAINLLSNHRCIERNLDSDCPICGEYMFTSTSTVIFMKCGHSIHWSCHQDHIKNSYQCPICWKSLADMTHYFQQIDRMLEQHKMPAEYEDVWSIVLCNDCEQKSKTKYHFLYHKCQHCQSYNTKLISTVHERLTGGGGGGGGDSDESNVVVNSTNGTEAVAAVHLQVSQTLGESNNRPRSSSAASAESRHTVFHDDNENRSRPT